MSNKYAFFWLLAFSLFIQIANGEVRTWTNSQGQKLEAELVEIRDDSVRIRSSENGKVYTYAISKLSAIDQEYISSLRDKNLSRLKGGDLTKKQEQINRLEGLLRGRLVTGAILKLLALVFSLFFIQALILYFSSLCVSRDKYQTRFLTAFGVIILLNLSACIQAFVIFLCSKSITAEEAVIILENGFLWDGWVQKSLLISLYIVWSLFVIGLVTRFLTFGVLRAIVAQFISVVIYLTIVWLIYYFASEHLLKEMGYKKEYDFFEWLLK